MGCSFSPLLVALFFAVFYRASAFNQDVSKWNTGAVTNMDMSKCNLSTFLRRQLDNSQFALFLVLERQCFIKQLCLIRTCQNGIRVQ